MFNTYEMVVQQAKIKTLFFTLSREAFSLSDSILYYYQKDNKNTYMYNYSELLLNAEQNDMILMENHIDGMLEVSDVIYIKYFKRNFSRHCM